VIGFGRSSREEFYALHDVDLDIVEGSTSGCSVTTARENPRC